MAIEFQNQFVFGEFIDDPLVEQVYLIVSYIKAQDYLSAYGIMLQNNMSIENIISKTQTLKNKDLVKFVDFVISQQR